MKKLIEKKAREGVEGTTLGLEELETAFVVMVPGTLSAMLLGGALGALLASRRNPERTGMAATIDDPAGVLVLTTGHVGLVGTTKGTGRVTGLEAQFPRAMIASVSIKSKLAGHRLAVTFADGSTVSFDTGKDKAIRKFVSAFS